MMTQESTKSYPKLEDTGYCMRSIPTYNFYTGAFPIPIANLLNRLGIQRVVGERVCLDSPAEPRPFACSGCGYAERLTMCSPCLEAEYEEAYGITCSSCGSESIVPA